MGHSCPTVTLNHVSVMKKAEVVENGSEVAGFLVQSNSKAENSTKIESRRVSSGSTRTVGGGDRKSDRSSSSTQGVFSAKVGDDRNGVAPKCQYGVYAILYLSKRKTIPTDFSLGVHFSRQTKQLMVSMCRTLHHQQQLQGDIGQSRLFEGR
ncbi:hypothetical protein PIB30_099774 [Stylosanthes scabra]|uniref:Uncharacterized protein n=1 Tax=Stylosanthes scabra TaxID=79078 RepID=A0ABU6TWK9_9FABA|nr:hypothetical protein [Stylosanthes scabra]